MTKKELKPWKIMAAKWLEKNDVIGNSYSYHQGYEATLLTDNLARLLRKISKNSSKTSEY